MDKSAQFQVSRGNNFDQMSDMTRRRSSMSFQGHGRSSQDDLNFLNVFVCLQAICWSSIIKLCCMHSKDTGLFPILVLST